MEAEEIKEGKGTAAAPTDGAAPEPAETETVETETVDTALNEWAPDGPVQFLQWAVKAGKRDSASFDLTKRSERVRFMTETIKLPEGLQKVESIRFRVRSDIKGLRRSADTYKRTDDSGPRTLVRSETDQLGDFDACETPYDFAFAATSTPAGSFARAGEYEVIMQYTDANGETLTHHQFRYSIVSRRSPMTLLRLWSDHGNRVVRCFDFADPRHIRTAFDYSDPDEARKLERPLGVDLIEGTSYVDVLVFSVEKRDLVNLCRREELFKGPIRLRSEVMGMGNYRARAEPYEHRFQSTNIASGLLVRGQFRVTVSFYDDQDSDLESFTLTSRVVKRE